MIHKRSISTSSRRGLTLMEMLFTVVIMALVAGVLMVRLSGASRSTQLRAATANWLDLDRRGRLLAPREGPMALEVDPDGRRLVLRRLDDESALFSATLPAFATGELSVSGDDHVLIDRRGRSADYRMVIRTVDPLSQQTWQIAGILGSVHEEARR